MAKVALTSAISDWDLACITSNKPSALDLGKPLASRALDVSGTVAFLKVHGSDDGVGGDRGLVENRRQAAASRRTSIVLLEERERETERRVRAGFETRKEPLYLSSF